MADLGSSATGTIQSDAPGHPGLRENAIGLADAIIVGMASSGPTGRSAYFSQPIEAYDPAAARGTAS